MFYPEKFILNLLECPLCSKKYSEDNDPRILPCGDTVCDDCLLTIKVDEKQSFKCISCPKKHMNPEEGFAVNTLVLDLISLEAHDVTRSKETELFKNDLKELESLIEQLKNGSKTEIDKVKEHCIELKQIVQLATEQKIKQINEYNQTFMKKIDDYEQECAVKCSLNNELINETNDLIQSNRKYLQSFEIDEEVILESIEELKKYRDHLEKQLATVKNESNHRELMQFEANENDLDEELIGSFYIKQSDSLYSRIITGSTDNSIKIWSLTSGKCIKTLRGHTKEVTCIIKVGEDRILSGSKDKTIKYWDCKTSTCLMTLTGHLSALTNIEMLSDEQFASSSDDNTIKIWDLNIETCLVTFSTHSDFVNYIIRLNNDKIASCSDDKTIKISDSTTGECSMTLEGHKEAVKCILELSNDKLCSCSSDKTIKVWDLKSGECVQTIEEAHAYGVKYLEFISDDCIVSCGEDSLIKIWNLLNGKCLGTLKGHSDNVNCVKYISDDRIVTCSDDKKIKLWDLMTEQCLSTLDGHFAQVNCVEII